MSNNLEDYKKLLIFLSEKFSLTQDKLHDLITCLFVPNPKTEVARIICHEEDERIGISFHVELVPTDAIQIYTQAKEFCPKLELFQIYYYDSQGKTYMGMDAQIMLEQDRQDKYFKSFAQNEKIREAEELEVQKTGKVTLH